MNNAVVKLKIESIESADLHILTDHSAVDTSLGIEQVRIIRVADQTPVYEGPINAIPSAIQQVFSTKDKILRDDFIVEEIPFSKATNDSGGYTVTIGG